jgi:5-formyltetrahydrofolate cyclo-ligase
MELPDLKQEARRRASLNRQRLQQVIGQKGAHSIASVRLPFEPRAGANVLSGFFPFREEIDVLPLMGALAGEGWVCSLPVVTAPKQPLLFRKWYPGEPTVHGKWDIPVPSPDAPEVLPDAVLVPLLAFDKEGFRLGYGGGFYDLTLAKLRKMKTVTAIGVGFAGQEIPHIPREAHDQPLDFMLTEKGIVRCG